jgi:N-acetyl-gamma-glutamyl-phosphate reductase
MVRVGVLGGRGYTAGELLRLLVRHPGVEVTAVVSRKELGEPISQVHPWLRGQLDLPLTQSSNVQLAEQCDCVFSCLPHTASAEAVGELLKLGVRVIDFSADFRLNDLETYEHWYQVKHPVPQLVGQTVYGLPELFRDEIRSANLVANPGCFPTTAILALTPLILADLIQSEGIIVDSKSGVSGAGRQADEAFSFCEVNEATSAYKIGKHRHMPEMEQIITRASQRATQILFTPHLVPMNRGILSTIYANPNPGTTLETWTECLTEFYRAEPFVDVVSHLPKTSEVVGTNRCVISVSRSRGRVVIVSCIDNLLKGASGAAVQNFNLMYGLPETTALG